MSNSIWKTKAIVPEENGKQILVKFQNNWWHTEKITRRMMREWPDYYETGYLEWCHLDELLAQADKAEHLQKALDVAVDAFKNATEYLGNQEPLVDVMAMNLHIDLSKALEQITALTNGGNNE